MSYGNDPFYAGMPGRRAEAEWFARIWRELGVGHGVHLRRIHYRLVSQREPVLMVNGKPYVNTNECWQALGEASKGARYLDLVPIAAFVDRRNDEPISPIPQGGSPGSLQLYDAALSISYERASMPLQPSLYLIPPTPTQPFHIELWAEKTTMNDVLLPLARRYGACVVTAPGEVSLTACHLLVERAKASRRPVRILYICTCKPVDCHEPGVPPILLKPVDHLVQTGNRDHAGPPYSIP
jgi:hypothetical protein